MDGVIYRGTETLPFARECVKLLREHGARTGFLTNNSTRARSDYVEILSRHGIVALENEIMTSGEATARHLLAQGLAHDRIYVIGGDGLVRTLSRAGFTVDIADGGDPCRFVVVGWDKTFNFRKIVRAQTEIITNKAHLIATNTDAMFPAAGGKLLPGAGAMVAAVETASGTKAELIGKPNAISLRYLLQGLGIPEDNPPDDVWMVGDRIDTDIACGKAIGAHTVLITSGISDRDQAEKTPENLRPDFVIDSLLHLPDLLPLTGGI